MLRLSGRVITVIALCLAIGLHWVALQSIAWTAMLLRNAQQASFCEAVKRTFDGAHPCDMCKGISKANSTQKKQDTQRSISKADLICVVRKFALLPPASPVAYSEMVTLLQDASQQPPSPPPRAMRA